MVTNSYNPRKNSDIFHFPSVHAKKIICVAFYLSYKLMRLYTFPLLSILVFCVSLAAENDRTIDGYIKSIKTNSVLRVYRPPAPEALLEKPGSLIETENLKKPLSVAQFSEWLHNLYYNEEQKRKSTIKYMLENLFEKKTD